MKREKVKKLPHKRDRSEVLFETLVRENERAVTAFLRTMVRDPGFVDDLFQETLITAWNKFDEFDPSRSLGPWLRGIAFNLVRNAARSRKRDCLVFGAAATMEPKVIESKHAIGQFSLGNESVAVYISFDRRCAHFPGLLQT